jgi:hypothetical protein
MPFSLLKFLGAMLLTASTLYSPLRAEPIAVRYPQGSNHGFLLLETLDGIPLATGELTQVVRGDRVTSSLIFRFRDGSIDRDVTVFSQRGVFRLISDHLIQHGPSFPKPVDFSIDAAGGTLTSRALDGKVTQQHMDLPADVSNGLPPNLLLNIQPTTPETRISYVAPGDKPRLVHLLIKPGGTLPFKVGAFRRTATDFTLHVELGGVAGVVAPVIGKQPADYHIWLQSGNPPGFVSEEGQLYEGGPVWRIQQAVPTFAH